MKLQFPLIDSTLYIKESRRERRICACVPSRGLAGYIASLDQLEESAVPAEGTMALEAERQPDLFGRHRHRYWDGSAETAHVADGCRQIGQTEIATCDERIECS